MPPLHTAENCLMDVSNSWLLCRSWLCRIAVCLPHARKVGNSHDSTLRIIVEQHGVKCCASTHPM